jgi:hypothetical protein
MRTRWFVPFAVLAVILAACTRIPQRAPKAQVAATPPPTGEAPQQAGDLLLLGSGSGVTLLDPTTGSAVWGGPAVPSLPGWSELFTTARQGGITLVQTISAISGTTMSTTSIRGSLAIRVASTDGNRIALMAPPPPGTNPWTPPPRRFTAIVVADPTGQVLPRRFHLKGNFEPEAFSTDDSSLFLIQYLPPTDPRAYRVTRLDLADGDVYPVFGRQKSPVETMTGTRLHQITSPQGSALYTLYTSQPPAYAEGYDEAQARSARPVAFIHTLSLASQWAVCVALPRALWGGNPVHEAMAVSPDGARLYVVDTERGVVAVLDTNDLVVDRTARIDFGQLRGGQTHAVISPDGRTLLVSSGFGVATVDVEGLGLFREWTAPGEISGLGLSPDGRRLYLSLPGEIQMMDASTGRALDMIHVPGVDGIEHVGAVSA